MSAKEVSANVQVGWLIVLLVFFVDPPNLDRFGALDHLEVKLCRPPLTRRRTVYSPSYVQEEQNDQLAESSMISDVNVRYQALIVSSDTF